MHGTSGFERANQGVSRLKMIFFDIDGTLVDHKGAERVAAFAFQRAHGEVFPESPEDFAARWHLVAEKHLRRHLVGEISFQGQRRARLRELFSHHSALTDEEADESLALSVGFGGDWPALGFDLGAGVLLLQDFLFGPTRAAALLAAELGDALRFRAGRSEDLTLDLVGE